MVQQFVPDVEKVRERFAEVEGRVAAAAVAAGRDPAATRVLVATKYVAAEHLGALAEAGVRLIGENRAQDLVAKHALYGDTFDYHFIGHLQSRKTKLILPIATLIHSVSTMSVVREIDARAEAPADVLLEVNIGGEESKSGVAPADADAFLEEAAGHVGVRFAGLMCMPPLFADPAQARPYFARDTRVGATAFDKVARHVYFRPAIDGHECRLRGRRPGRRDHRACGQCALLTR